MGKKIVILVLVIAAVCVLYVTNEDKFNFEFNRNDVSSNIEIENNDESKNEQSVEKTEKNDTEVEPFTFVPKQLEKTPDEEMVSEQEAMENARKDANKYASIEKNPIVKMVIKNKGTITMELYPTIAPETVENFISLINKGVYDGLIFHRLKPGFMAQGGDPEGTGTGGPDYSIVGEFAANQIKNNLSHERGILSMARSNEVNSAGSQFFIVTTNSEFLDGSYAAFGKVIDGMDVVDEVVNEEVYIREEDVDLSKIQTLEQYIEILSQVDRPINPPVIEKVTVETFGVKYDEPEKIRPKVAGEIIEENAETQSGEDAQSGEVAQNNENE